MKNLLIVFLLVFTSNIQAQSSKIDTFYREVWRNNSWQKINKSIFTYNEDCQRSTVLSMYFDQASQSWMNSTLDSETYVGRDYRSIKLTKSWSSATNTWKNSQKWTTTYNDSFKILTDAIEDWENNDWKMYYRHTNTYDNNGYMITQLIETAGFGPLHNSNLSIYTNNNEGTAKEVLSKRWNSENSSWEPSAKETLAYNADKSISSITIEWWNKNISQWYLGQKTTYTYNASGKQITTLIQSGENNQWINQGLTTKTYDANDYCIKSITQAWDVTSQSWSTTREYDYINYSDGAIYQEFMKELNPYTKVWDSLRYHYLRSSSCTLPLHLTSFNAARNENIVSLNWETASEINTSHFVIQRSLNGTTFTNIGNVTAKGNSTLSQPYSFTDNIDKLVADKIYYRLQMADKDGSYTFSKIVPVTLDPYKGNVKAYPNPVKDQVFVLFNMQNATRAELRIVNAAGNAVHSQRITTAQQNNSISVNVSALPKGTYFIQVITDKGMQKTQFIKQ